MAAAEAKSRAALMSAWGLDGRDYDAEGSDHEAAAADVELDQGQGIDRAGVKVHLRARTRAH